MLKKKFDADLTYLSITNGSLLSTSGETRGETYESLDGHLLNIRRGKSQFSTVDNWYIEFEDIDDPAKRYILSLAYTSGAFVSIVQCLRSYVDNLTAQTPIRIDTYKKDGYNKVTVYADGIKLDWHTKEMPLVKQKGAGKYAKDFSERMAFVDGLVSDINTALFSTVLEPTKRKKKNSKK